MQAGTALDGKSFNTSWNQRQKEAAQRHLCTLRRNLSAKEGQPTSATVEDLQCVTKTVTVGLRGQGRDPSQTAEQNRSSQKLPADLPSRLQGVTLGRGYGELGGWEGLLAIACVAAAIFIELWWTHATSTTTPSEGGVRSQIGQAGDGEGSGTGTRCHVMHMFLQLALVGLAGRQLGFLVAHHWQRLPLPSVEDSFAFAGFSALKSAMPDLCGPAACIAMMAADQVGWLGPYGALYDQNGGWRPWGPALRDLVLLLLLASVLGVCQMTSELLYSSRILVGHKSRLLQNARERWVLACLLRSATAPAATDADSTKGLTREQTFNLVPELEEVDEREPMVFERACTELLTSSHPQGELWSALISLGAERRPEKNLAELEPETGDQEESDDEEEGVAIGLGAQVLFQRLTGMVEPGGRLKYETLELTLQNSEEASRFWALLKVVDGAAAAAAPISAASQVRKATSLHPHPKLTRRPTLTPAQRTVGEDAFAELVLSTYAETSQLVAAVGENSAIFALFCKVLRAVRMGVVVLAVVMRFAPEEWLRSFSWLVSSTLLAVSFAWGPVLLEVMQSLVLLLHICPYDRGDKVIFKGSLLTVASIRLMHTVFQTPYNEEVYLRNAVIYADSGGLLNLSRSGCAAVSIELVLPGDAVTSEQLDALTAFAQGRVASRPEHWQPGVSSGVMPSEQGDAGVLVAMEKVPNYALRWRLSATHQLSRLDSVQVRADATQLLAELIEEARRLGFAWPGVHGSVLPLGSDGER